jgi:hypothetical protein
MPRGMPRLDLVFSGKAARALEIARVGESIRTSSGVSSIAYRELYPARLEELYELAYLKVFISWEGFLEDSFLRYMCGYQSNLGQATMKGGIPYYNSLARAETALLAGHQYTLWANPQVVLSRVCKHVLNGSHESVIAASQASLTNFAAIRHRIAHGQADARNKFDQATMAIAGRRYAGARAGKFLRDWDSSLNPPVRRLESITRSLGAYASSIL